MPGAVSLLVVPAVLLAVVYRPYDIWWAGSVWSRPGLVPVAMVLVTLVGGALLVIQGRHPGPDSEATWSPRGEAVAAVGLCVALGLFLLCLPADGVVGDELDAFDAMRVHGSAAGVTLLFKMSRGAGMWLAGDDAAGLRAVLLVLGVAWAAGWWLAARAVLGVAGCRTMAMAAGFSFSLPVAQFAGYFETSGVAAVCLPWLLWFSTWDPGPRRVVALLGGVVVAAWMHASFVALVPFAAFAAAWGRPSVPYGTRAAELARPLFLSLVFAVGAVAAFAVLSFAARALDGPGASLLPGAFSGGDDRALLPFGPATLVEAHFAAYPLFSWHWVVERASFLAVCGGLALPALLVAAASSARRGGGLDTSWLAVAGGGLFVALWGFDWGLVRDWNLASPMVLAMAGAAALAARDALRRARGSVIAALALSLAVPGIVLVVHQSVAGARAGIPDQDRWVSLQSPGVVVAGADPDDGRLILWRETGIEVEGGRPVVLRLSPLKWRSAGVDCVEFRAPSGALVRVEPERHPDVQRFEGRLRMILYLDGRWQAEPDALYASGGGYAVAYRTEHPPPLEFPLDLPPGRWSVHVRLLNSQGYDPVELLNYVRVEVLTP